MADADARREYLANPEAKLPARGNPTVRGSLADAVGIEADALSKALESRFPGFSATDIGMQMDPQEIQRAGTMEGWPP